MSRLVATVLCLGMSACARPTPVLPSTSPLAKLSYDQQPPALFVGDKQAWVTSGDSRYTSLLDGRAREVAEESHRNRRIAAFINLGATATAMAAIVLAIVSRDNFFDPHTRPGKAMIGLTIGSVTIGAISGIFKRKARAGIHEAVYVYNDSVLQRELARANEAAGRRAPAPTEPAASAPPLALDGASDEPPVRRASEEPKPPEVPEEQTPSTVPAAPPRADGAR